MTSTSFNVGLGDGSRLSSRVLRPPGGGHTDIFGGEPEPPRTGRRPAQACGQADEPAKPTNGAEAPSQNGQAAESPQEPAPSPVQATTPVETKTESPKAVTPTEPRNEAPKRVRVPPEGGGSSGSRQSRLLGRLLGKLRGEHRFSALDKNYSFSSAGMSEIGCGSAADEIEPPAVAATSTDPLDDVQFAANIDMRYSGQYLTPEQLPEFCNQLHHLVEVIRNIQSYAEVTGEYPSELEKRLEAEAREVASLAAEARNARNAAHRAREQRRTLRAERMDLVAHLARLRDNEIRELESSVRVSDRRLFRTWEALKDSTDPAAFEPLLDEVRNKQNALDCLVRLIECRRSSVVHTSPHPLPAPNHDTEEECSLNMSSGRPRCERRSSNKRRRKEHREPRSEPLSEEPSAHSPQQVTLYIQGECATRPLHLPARASVRDILFFTTN